jgi:hypothetical protein
MSLDLQGQMGSAELGLVADHISPEPIIIRLFNLLIMYIMLNSILICLCIHKIFLSRLATQLTEGLQPPYHFEAA